jgi:RNA polymerase sigma-32 factor
MMKKPMNRSSFPALENQQLARRARMAPMLERDVEIALARRWRDEADERALSRLTESYLRLVIAMAGRFRGYGLPLSDLVQEGTVGLMEAAKRFDPERDIRFATYASWWIRSAMQDFILRNWSIVRTGTTAAHKSLFFNLRRLKARIFGTHDTLLDTSARQAIAEHMGVREQDVALMDARLTAGDRSLNMMIGEEGDSQAQDMLACEAPRPDEIVEQRNDSRVRARLLMEAMQTLTARERQIIEERQLAAGDGEGLTLAALGERLGVSKERIRQIEAQAMAKLKAALLGRIANPASAGLFAG